MDSTAPEEEYFYIGGDGAAVSVVSSNLGMGGIEDIGDDANVLHGLIDESGEVVSVIVTPDDADASLRWIETVVQEQINTRNEIEANIASGNIPEVMDGVSVSAMADRRLQDDLDDASRVALRLYDIKEAEVITAEECASMASEEPDPQPDVVEPWREGADGRASSTFLQTVEGFADAMPGTHAPQITAIVARDELRPRITGGKATRKRDSEAMMVCLRKGFCVNNPKAEKYLKKKYEVPGNTFLITPINPDACPPEFAVGTSGSTRN